jgi:hypothetical protein
MLVSNLKCTFNATDKNLWVRSKKISAEGQTVFVSKTMYVCILALPTYVHTLLTQNRIGLKILTDQIVVFKRSTYVCIPIYICTYVRMYTHLRMYICMYVYPSTYVHMYVYPSTYVHMYVYPSTNVCIYVCIPIYKCMYICTCARMRNTALEVFFNMCKPFNWHKTEFLLEGQ